MKKVIIINGHGAPMMSMDNKRILEDVKAQLQDVEIVTLAELYPDFKIDVEKEQTRLLAADLIVFEYPIWWYSAPSILKKYVEDVFAMGSRSDPAVTNLKVRNSSTLSHAGHRKRTICRGLRERI